ncbi:MAG: hypothetical protein ACLQF4_17385 [Xanthobacteraceae bacterium]
MFPNVRLIVVAILAAITGIGCGLGLFATFRINHEPLARLAEGSPPLQLAFDNRALGSDARTPMEARLPVNGAAKVIPVPVIIATPSPAAEQAGADSTIAGDSSVQQAAAGAIAVDQSNTASVALSSLAVAVPAEQSSVTPEAVAPGQQEAVAAVPDRQPAEQSAAVNAAAEDQQPAAKPTKSEESEAAKPAARVSRPAAPARRAAKAVRARRTVAMVAAQPTYQYSQPTYARTDGTAQASRSVKRVQIKRHRTAKKAPAVQSNPSAATAGLSTQ